MEPNQPLYDINEFDEEFMYKILKHHTDLTSMDLSSQDSYQNDSMNETEEDSIPEPPTLIRQEKAEVFAWHFTPTARTITVEDRHLPPNPEPRRSKLKLERKRPLALPINPHADMYNTPVNGIGIVQLQGGTIRYTKRGKFLY
jgi:hypothetical protein